MNQCPTEAELHRFVTGAPPGAVRRDVASHLAQCARCRDRCAELGAEEEIAGKVRAAFRNRTPASPQQIDPPESMASLLHLDDYTIQEEIGRGGMGVVYRAVQRSTKRPVALKVMIGGALASPAARARFQREIELAAALEHPNIVSIFDSGRHADCIYFAMQHVDGCPLAQYLSSHDHPVRPVLSLFLRICDAVNYAHQRGVIHRDLKASNIMVDSEGRPYVLDFGLAKAFGKVGREPGARGAEAPTDQAGCSLVSISGQVMGTLPYISPEQVMGSARDVDIRSDVYSLGVVLFEMLTRELPYETGDSVPAILRAIAEAEPRSPCGITKDLPQGRRVDRDLDAIVLKALSKSKQRRYQTVREMTADIERYLSGEAVEARRASRLYTFRKSLRRYRAYVTAGVILVAGLSAFGLVSMGWYLEAAGHARSNARYAFLEAELAFGQGRYPEALEKVDQALRLDERLDGAQLLRANLLLAAGRKDEAHAFLERILEQDPRAWAAHYALATVYAADRQRAAFHQQRVAALRPDTAEAFYASSLIVAGEEALELLDRALQRDPMHYESLIRRGRVLLHAGRWDEARRDAEHAIRARPGDYQGWWGKGEALLRQRRFEDGVEHFSEALRIRPNATIYCSRATAYRRLHLYHQAIADYCEAVKITPPNAEFPWIPYQRATLYWIVGDEEAALRDYESFAALHNAPFWAEARRSLILSDLDRPEDARRCLQHAYERVDHDQWLARVLELLLGQRSAASLLSCAVTDVQRCEAHFYIAERRRLDDDLEGARGSYVACVNTGVDRDPANLAYEVTPFNEYELAEWRLEQSRSTRQEAHVAENGGL